MKYFTLIAISALCITLVQASHGASEVTSDVDEIDELLVELRSPPQIVDVQIKDDDFDDILGQLELMVGDKLALPTPNPPKSKNEVVNEGQESLVHEEEFKEKEKVDSRKNIEKGIKNWSWPRLVAAASILGCIALLIIIVPVMICTGSCCCCP